TAAIVYSFLLIYHPPPTLTYPLSLHDALPISDFNDGRLSASHRRSTERYCSSGLLALLRADATTGPQGHIRRGSSLDNNGDGSRSEEHTSELQSLRHLVCRLLLEKKNNKNKSI